MNYKDSIRLAIMTRDFEGAIKFYDEGEKDHDALNNVAIAMHMMGYTRRAIDILERCLFHAPKHVPAMLNLRYMKLALDAYESKPSFKIVGDWGAPALNDPLISVVIPTYGRPVYLAEAVSSALDQSLKNVEIIVVNDGGPNDAEDVLKKMASDRIRYAVIEHRGTSAAKNAGVSLARGKYIAYLDDDDIHLPGHLQGLLDALEKNPSSPLAYSYAWRNEIEETDGGWKTIKRSIYQPHPYEKDRLLKSNIIQCMGCVMHRRELTEAVGGFNETLRASEEWEFYLRVAEKYQLTCVGEPTMEYRVRKRKGDQLTAKPRVMRTSNMTVRYMRRLLFVPSPEAERANSISFLGELIDKWPDIIEVVDVNELVNRKPYAAFFRLGKDLAATGEREKSKAAFWKAFRLAPWEIKIYRELIR